MIAFILKEQTKGLCQTIVLFHSV